MKRMIKTVGALGVFGCAIISNSAALAATPADNGWYLGLSLGESRAAIDDDRIRSGLAGSGFSTTTINDDESDIGYKAFGGYKFNKYFALEGGYFNLGEFSFDATTVPAGNLTGRTQIQGVNFDALGMFPLTQKLSALGRLGVQYANVEDEFRGSGALTVADSTPHKDAANYKAGVGLQYDFTKRLAMRTEWERYRINDAVGNRGDVDLFSVGLLVKFGGDKADPAPAKKTEAPAKRVAAAPALVVVPVKKTDEYCSILDIHFEINADEIQREEKEKLAVLGTFMKKYPDTTAVIEGHTDNVGTAEQKQTLSQHRAESVVRYLIDELHIDASRLQALGYGDTRPMAENTTQEGKRLNRRINAVIACVTDVEGLKVAAARVTMAVLVEFDAHKADVKPEYRGELQKVAKFLKANPKLTATVQGHTGDLQKTTAASQEISQRRAQNVVNYLVNEFGVERSRLTAEGFGQTRRFAYNTSLEGQQENRRVNVIINYAK